MSRSENEPAQQAVQRDCRFEIASKRFFDDDARAVGTARRAEIVQDRGEHARRNGEVEERMFGAGQRLA